MKLKVTGHCFCGHIQYTATVNSNLVIVCHCTSCQRHSGTAYGVVVGIVDDSFSLKSGSMKSYETLSDSGSVRSRTFCPECGTRIYAKTVGEGMSFVSLRVGTVDQREQLRPHVQVWCRSAQPWAVIESIPRYEKQPNIDELAELSID